MEKKADQKNEVMRQVMDALEGILCSYQGRGYQSAYTDLDSFAFLANLFISEKMNVEKYQYEYDSAIRKDEEAVRIYEELAPQTRWRLGCYTQIETVRMNALKQFAAMGTPVYDGHIYYADTGCMLICGEILPFQMFQLFFDRPEVKKLYIYPYPFREEKKKPAYFSFAPTEAAQEEIKKYMEKRWEKVRQISESISKHVIPDAKRTDF